MNNKEIKELIDLFAAANIGKLKIKEGEFEISLEQACEPCSKEAAAAPVCPAPAPINISVASANNAPVSSQPAITSPMVGTFYEAPSPGAASFVKVGQSVKKGETICIIEAMKIMNEIEAEFDCKIVSRLVEDGQPVEFGTELFSIERL